MATFTQTVSGTNDIQGHGTSTFDGFAMGKEGTQSKYFGARFTNVTIPAGSTINSATVQITSAGIAAGSAAGVHATISCEATDNAGAFGTGASSRIFTATPTSATTAWEPSTGGVSWSPGTVRTSPDLAASVQEVINRGGWASGNSLAVLVRDNASSNSNTIEGNDNTFAITIDYTAGGGGGSSQPPRSLHQFRMRRAA